MRPASRRWLSFHLFYHEDRDRLIAELVQPLVAGLWRGGRIDGFFFVRFPLGGPHVRLRLRTRDGSGIGKRVVAAAEEFFAAHPSREAVGEEVIRRQSRQIVQGDPQEDDETIHPDNSVAVCPFRPEVERYGGREGLAASLEFFTVSSAAGLDFLRAHRRDPPGRRLSHALRLMARQALGCARSGEELAALLAYPSSLQIGPMDGIRPRGDEAYERRPETFRTLLRREIEAAPEEPLDASSLLLHGARWLSATLDGFDGTRRREILVSHLHMTANRLGLRNPDEVYGARLLERALDDLRAAGEVPEPAGRRGPAAGESTLPAPIRSAVSELLR